MHILLKSLVEHVNPSESKSRNTYFQLLPPLISLLQRHQHISKNHPRPLHTRRQQTNTQNPPSTRSCKPGNHKNTPPPPQPTLAHLSVLKPTKPKTPNTNT